MKTANDIYKIAKGLMFEKPSSTIYDPYLIPNINRVIGELFNENNHERMWNDKAPLKNIPLISGRDEEVPYEEIYVNEIIPLGLAAYFLIDDDLNKHSIFITAYNNARLRYQRMIPQEKLDAFRNA